MQYRWAPCVHITTTNVAGLVICPNEQCGCLHPCESVSVSVCVSLLLALTISCMAALLCVSMLGMIDECAATGTLTRLEQME